MVNIKTSAAIKNKLLSHWELPLLFILLIGIWFSFPKTPGVFPLDDTYIHFSYARNLAETGTLCFNPGEPSLGTSSLLWVVILTPFYLLKIDLYWAVQILSLLLFGILCFLAMDIVKTSAIRLRFSEGEARACSLLAGLLLVLNGNLHWFALSGMETMLFLALSFLSIKMYSRRGFDYLTGIISGLVFLTRAPGALLGIIFILFDLAKKRFSSVYKGLIAMLLVISPYLLMSMHITGNWLPTTVKGKSVTYVDGGLNWERIPKSDLRNDKITRWLLYEGIIKPGKNQEYFYFDDNIKDEHQLRERLQPQISINENEIESILAGWRAHTKNHIYWYLKTLFSYQKYLPHNFILLTILSIMAFIIACKYWGNWRDFKKKAMTDHLEYWLLVVWGLLHLALYAIKFRILLHHSRYLANEYIVTAILGALGVLIFYRRKSKIGGVLLGIISIVLAASTLFYWQNLYANNVNHIDKVYIRMGEWINKNIPAEARIAAFDIGILRYIGNRYAVDLGGLVDPEVHSYLEKRECGEYVRQKRADYILYSRNLDVDYFTGIYLAEYQGPMLLKQIPVVHFETPQYEAPTLTHSYRMDLNQIIGWFPKTPAGILQVFSYDNRPFQPIGKMIDDRLEFVGYSLDQRTIEYIPLYPYTVNFTFLHRARKSLKHIYWVHTAFFHPQYNTILYLFDHIPTHNLLTYNRWPVNQIIQEHHIRFIPVNMPKMKFRIKLTITKEQFLDKKHPEKYTWFDLGSFENKGNRLKPMDHQQLMSLPLN